MTNGRKRFAFSGMTGLLHSTGGRTLSMPWITETGMIIKKLGKFLFHKKSGKMLPHSTARHIVSKLNTAH